MSRGNARLLAGAFTILAGIGAWVLGKKAGAAVERATATKPEPPKPPEEAEEPPADAVESPPK